MNKYTTTANMVERLQADLNGVSYALESDEGYTMKSARSDILFFIEEAKKEADEHGLHWLAIVPVVAVIKGVSRTALMKACNKAIEELEVLSRHQREQAAELEAQDVKPDLSTVIATAQPTLKAGFTLAIANTDRSGSHQVEIRKDGCLCWRGWEFESDFQWNLEKQIGYATEAKQEDKDAKRIEELKETISLLKGDLAYCQTRQQVANVYALIDSREAELAELVAPQEVQDETQGNTEQAFINRCVSALDAAGMAEHNVYIHWFRINYGCWINASDVVEAGGLAQYLKSIGLNESDVTELMTQDWDCQDAEGLALKCLGSYGSFDWKLMGELLEAAEECGEDVVHAALSAGIPATEAGDKYLGQWESMEDYAYDHWESCGLLESIPEAARGYLDWEAIARDIQFNGDVCESSGHYFCAC